MTHYQNLRDVKPMAAPVINAPKGPIKAGRWVRVRQLAYTRDESGNVVPGILPFSVPTCWRLAAKGAIPKPHKLSDGVTAWNLDEIEAFLAAKQNGGAV